MDRRATLFFPAVSLTTLTFATAQQEPSYHLPSSLVTRWARAAKAAA